MTTPPFAYVCASCKRAMDFDDVLCAAGPNGAAMFCRDIEACKNARAAAKADQ